MVNMELDGRPLKVIEEKMENLDVESSTRSADDIYRRHTQNIESFVNAIRHVPSQCGAGFAINHRIIGIDIFDNPMMMSKMLPKLVRSYAMDAIDAPMQGHSSGNEPLTSFLSDLAEARIERFPAVGLVLLDLVIGIVITVASDRMLT